MEHIIDMLKLGILDINDKQKVILLSCCKKMDFLKNFLWFNDQAMHYRVVNLSYFDRFTNMYICGKVMLPKNIKRITFGILFDESIVGYIPSTVTHLLFSCGFNKPIKNSIPASVTHIRFASDFDQPIEECIPESATHIQFGRNFNQPIKGYIPRSVTHIRFGRDHYQFIKEDDIPPTVSHMVFFQISGPLKI